MLDDISPEGALAGRTLAVVLAASGVALVVASWGDLWRRCEPLASSCNEHAAAAGLLTIFSVLAIGGAVGLWFRIRRRPVDAMGSSRYVWALGVLFAVGVALIAARIPAFRCERGRFDDALQLCMHPPSTSDPASWLWAKKLIVVLGLVGGVLIAMRPRAVRFTMWVAVLAWTAGLGWEAIDVVVRHGR